MGNWKELGEVPDSDGEDFDSQNTGGLETTDVPVSGHDARKAQVSEAADDIWSIPSSSLGVKDTRRHSQEVGGHQSTTATSSAVPVLHPADFDDGQPDEDGASTQSGTGGHNALRPTVPSQSIDSSPLSEVDDTMLGFPEMLSEPLSAMDVRLSRSLRPRKPIQEHPYLLENAQYSHFMKEHGFRPIRVNAPSQDTGKQDNEDDSQDKEFEAEESQVTTALLPAGESDENMTRPVDDRYERDELALSPSPRTSSPRRKLPVSSQPSHSDQTDETSVVEDEDLPTLDDLARHGQTLSAKSNKRRRPSRPTSPRKRLKIPPSFWDLSSSPEASPLRRSKTVSRAPAMSRSHAMQRAESSPVSLSSRSSPSPKRLSQNAAIHGDVSDPEDANSAREEASQSDSNSEIVRRNGKRIRGVLPASWLRLDQKTGRAVLATVSSHRKSPVPEPSPVLRKGIAIVRHINPKAGHISDEFLNDLYDHDDNDIPSLPEPDLVSMMDHEPSTIYGDDDDDVIEEDSIDRMSPLRKRARPSAAGNEGVVKRRRKQQQLHTGSHKKKQRQQKISTLINNPKAKTSLRTGKTSDNSSRNAAYRAKPGLVQHPERRIPPPLLSIADLIQPEAPRFIRIAVRTAMKRKDMGKSSPSRKHINLGSRRDNIDALSALADWKSGRIKPSVPYVPSRPKPSRGGPRQALEPISANLRATSTQIVPRLPLTQRPRKLAKQTSLSGFVRQDRDSAITVMANRSSSSTSHQMARTLSRRQAGIHRPAQLEITDQDHSDTAGFVARKRALDALYRKARRDAPAPSVHLQSFVRSDSPTSADVRNAAPGDAGPQAHTIDQQNRPRVRSRKRDVPKHVDLSAPHFVHANDPLPAVDDTVPAIDVGTSQEHKLHNLSPFGAHYTHHFDVFPLDAGVFFHESTLIGSGVLVEALDPDYVEKLQRVRPGTFFQLGEQSLRWGVWDDTVSSELGVLFDWLSDQLNDIDKHGQTDSYSPIVAASDFILGYVLRSLSFPEDQDGKSFVKRLSELISAFTVRLRTPPARQDLIGHAPYIHGCLEIQMRVIMIAFLLTKVCRGSLALTLETTQSEQILLEVTKSTILNLLRLGLDDIRTAYDDLQLLSTRERGIRSDRLALNCWVLVIRVLENAHIPRGGFWDVTYSCMAPTATLLGSDAQHFEGLWRNIFTLLPLGEFDDSGVMVLGLRHSVPIHGWALPQQLLKRVFEIYQINPRQSPGFNDYCRAIVGRCHFLIQQWGWYKCTGIMGTIFDFFGLRNLAHLRNEEVYKSPRFLEELTGQPWLSIEAEDRCFHIFLKMLALVIKRYRSLGMSKDIRNLVARVLPNHNRQYSKEQAIHQHDLAALRNHHDLVCTLFWSAPPEFRPAVHVLEKLVQPGTSHKEACLIGLRAWNQLARFVASAGEGSESYKPLMQWQSNVFQTTLDQFLSAAADIQQQFMSLSKDVSTGISQDMIKGMVSKNKAAAMDVLHFTVKASLDVLKHANSLDVATYTLNTGQFEKVFTKLDVAADDFDWSVLRAAVETIDYYVGMIEKASDEQYSSKTDVIHNPEDIEEAVLLLDQRLASPLFSMVRNALGLCDRRVLLETDDKTVCMEKTVILCARVASRFIQSGVTRLLHFFKPGKYCLFDCAPVKLDLSKRRYLTLFVAWLVKNNIFDFKELDTTLFEFWMTAIIKPLPYMSYEGYLAEVLSIHNFPFLDDVHVPPGVTPDYNTARDFFSAGLSYIRTSLQSANAGRKKQVRSDFAKSLRLVMEQMKKSLQDLVLDPPDHRPYVMFVRGIIALIKTYGTDICPVESFYYQPSPEYAPSREDPQLHTAGIVAFGLRLGEGELTAAPQLFYYLFNNFKTAMATGLLMDETKILENSFTNTSVVSFVIGHMLPAIIRATSEASDAWVLLKVYHSALRGLLSRSCLPIELPIDRVEEVSDLLDTILDWLRRKRENSVMGTRVSLAEMHIIKLCMGLCNLLRRTLVSWSIEQVTPDNGRLTRLIDEITGFAKEALSYLEKSIDSTDGERGFENLRARDLLVGSLPVNPSNMVPWGGKSPHIVSFSDHIAADVTKNWIVTASGISVKVPVKAHGAPATQSGEGSKYGLESPRDIMTDLYQELHLWVSEMDIELGTRRSRRGHRFWRYIDGLAM